VKFFYTMITGIVLCVSAASALGQVNNQKAEQKPKPALVDGIVAVVNDEILLHSEVLVWTTQTARMKGINLQLQPEKFNDMYLSTLNKLVDAKVEVAKALEDTAVTVTDEELDQAIDRELNNLIEKEGSEKDLTENYGMPVKKIREILASRLRDEILIGKLRERKSADVTVSRADIESFYAAFKDSIQQKPDIYEISHILKIPQPEAAVVTKKRALIDSLRQLIIDGADFAELAKKYSDDTGSRDNGGDLGWVEKGQFIQEFENAALKLEKEEIAPVVRSSYGFHVIQLLDKQGNLYHPRHILIFLQPTPDDEARVADSLKVLRQRALDGEDFGGLSARYSDDKDVRDARGYIGVFQLDRLYPQYRKIIQGMQEGEISEPVKTESGYHIFKVDKLEKARKYNMVDDYEIIKSMALARKQNTEYLKWLKEIKKEMHIVIHSPVGAEAKKIK